MYIYPFAISFTVKKSRSSYYQCTGGQSLSEHPSSLSLLVHSILLWQMDLFIYKHASKILLYIYLAHLYKFNPI